MAIERNRSELVRQRRSWRIVRLAVLLSLLAHAVVLAYLSWKNPRTGVAASSADATQPTPRQAPAAKPPPPPPMTPDAVRGQFERGMERIAQLSEAEKTALLENKSTQLEEITTPQRVDAMAAFMAEAMPVPARAYEPVAEPPPGQIDVNSLLIYDVARAVNAAGEDTYIYIMVDKDGRTMDVPVAPGEEAAAEAVLKMHKSKLLRKVYLQMVMPALESQLRSEQGYSPGPGE